MSQESKSNKRQKSKKQDSLIGLKNFCLNHKILTIIVPALVLILATFSIWQIAIPHPVRLSDTSYGGSEQININTDEYNQLIADQASFIVFIDQPNCITANKLREMLNDIASKYQIHIYHIMWSDTSGTNLREKVKYYPSVAIIQQGEIKDALDANSDAHVAYYNSETDLENWLIRYFKL